MWRTTWTMGIELAVAAPFLVGAGCIQPQEAAVAKAGDSDLHIRLLFEDAEGQSQTVFSNWEAVRFSLFLVNVAEHPVLVACKPLESSFRFLVRDPTGLELTGSARVMADRACPDTEIQLKPGDSVPFTISFANFWFADDEGKHLEWADGTYSITSKYEGSKVSSDTASFRLVSP